MRFVAALLLLVSIPAYAQMVYRHASGDTVRATNKPCTSEKVLAHIPEPYRQHFRQGNATHNGKAFDVCYVVRPDGMVLWIWEDGDMGGAHKDEFRREHAS